MPLKLKPTPEELAHARRKEQRRNLKWRSHPSHSLASNSLGSYTVSSYTLASHARSSHASSRAGKKRKRQPAPEGEYDPAFDPAEKAWDPRVHLRSAASAASSAPLGSSTSGSVGTGGAGARARAAEGEGEEDESLFPSRSRLPEELADDLDAAVPVGAETYIPSRWRRPGAPPQGMGEEGDEEERARRGMWRRTHAAEAAQAEERQRARQAERRARRELLARAKLEALERERERERRRIEREERVRREAWTAYELGWTRLGELESVKWEDVPWPVYGYPASPEALTGEGMREFLLSRSHSEGKGKRERQREALLRWHPDKFEGRWMGKVRTEAERERIRRGVGVVVRFLGELAGEKE